MERQPLRPTKNLPEIMSRREMLEWLFLKASETGLLVGGISVMSYLTREKLAVRINDSQITAKEVIENNKPLKVRHFSREILEASAQALGGLSASTFTKEAFMGSLVGNIGIGLLGKGKTEKFSGWAGLLTAGSGRIIDILSTLAFSQYMADPRFIEYGFYNHLMEQSPTLSEAPSPDEVVKKNIPLFTIISAVGYKYPFFGGIYLGISPAIAKNNLQGAYLIKKGFDLGDEVKSLISKGANPDQVRLFLQNEVVKVKKKPRLHRNVVA